MKTVCEFNLNILVDILINDKFNCTARLGQIICQIFQIIQDLFDN